MSLLDTLFAAAPPDVSVWWLGDPEAQDSDRVGGKAANLSRLAADWPVPRGFCLAARLHGRIRAGEIGSAAVRRLVREPYHELCGGWWRREPVAVRSSAVDEDSADASFAGQHDTVLNVVGVRALADAVLRCCASAESDGARAYREAHGLASEGRMAVLVQRLIDADVSGVVFSADPISGSRDEVMINASWGLGEAVVDGRVTPDTVVVSRSDLAPVRRHVATKDIEVRRDRGGGTRTVDVPEQRQDVPALTDAQTREVASMAVQLEEQMGWPVDVEWCYREGEVFLLQCRPITSLTTS